MHAEIPTKFVMYCAQTAEQEAPIVWALSVSSKKVSSENDTLLVGRKRGVDWPGQAEKQADAAGGGDRDERDPLSFLGTRSVCVDSALMLTGPRSHFKTAQYGLECRQTQDVPVITLRNITRSKSRSAVTLKF